MSLGGINLPRVESIATSITARAKLPFKHLIDSSGNSIQRQRHGGFIRIQTDSDVYIIFGDSTIEATADINAIKIIKNTVDYFDISNLTATHIAFITLLSSANLDISIVDSRETRSTSIVANDINVRPTTDIGLYNELITAERTTLFNVSWAYSVNMDIVDVRTNNGGTVTQSEGKIQVSTGTNTNSQALIVTRDVVRYEPGQGAGVIFSFTFDEGVIGSNFCVGVGDEEDGYFFADIDGVLNTLRRRGGVKETHILTITAGATNSGNITITLDGSTKVIAVTAGDSIRDIVQKIIAEDFSNVSTGWSNVERGVTVIFRSFPAKIITGSVSFADTDTTLVAASFSRELTGVASTDDLTPQSGWNRDKLDGKGISGIDIAKTKGNVFKIGYRWLGYGPANFELGDPNEKFFDVVHVDEYGNKNTEPSILNPTLPFCIFAENTTNNTNLTVESSSVRGFVEGRVDFKGIPKSQDNTKDGITTLTNIITIRNKLIYNSQTNRVRLDFTAIGFSADGTKNAIFSIIKNAFIGGVPVFTDIKTGNSPAEFDIAGTTVTGGDLIHSGPLAKVGSIDIADIGRFIRDLAPGEQITLAMVSENSTIGTATVNWEEKP